MLNPREIVEKGIITADGGITEEQIQSDGIDIRIAETVVLKPKSFVNVLAVERVDMDGCYGTINIRSSFSRKGVFATSGLWDCGYKGPCGMSLYNMSDEDITIESGTRVAQMIFHPSAATERYNGFYNQVETHVSQFDLNK